MLCVMLCFELCIMFVCYVIRYVMCYVIYNLLCVVFCVMLCVMSYVIYYVIYFVGFLQARFSFKSIFFLKLLSHRFREEQRIHRHSRSTARNHLRFLENGLAKRVNRYCHGKSFLFFSGVFLF